MKKIICASTLTLLSLSCLAGDAPELRVVLKDLDTKKVCVYGKNVYSEGAVLKMENEVRVCKYFKDTYLSKEEIGLV